MKILSKVKDKIIFWRIKQAKKRLKRKILKKYFFDDVMIKKFLKENPNFDLQKNLNKEIDNFCINYLLYFFKINPENIFLQKNSADYYEQKNKKIIKKIQIFSYIDIKEFEKMETIFLKLFTKTERYYNFKNKIINISRKIL